jgi:hypothetical protein
VGVPRADMVVRCQRSQEMEKVLQTNVYRAHEEAWGWDGVGGPLAWPAVPVVDMSCAGCAGLSPEY